MSTFLKVIAGLLLTLPLGAYVAGTLVASQAEIPEQRDVVVVESTTTQGPPTAQPTGTPAGPDDGTDRPGGKDDERDDSGDDRGDDKGGDRDDDDRVQVVRPTPHDVDDHGGDDDGDDDRDDDTDDDD